MVEFSKLGELIPSMIGSCPQNIIPHDASVIWKKKKVVDGNLKKLLVFSEINLAKKIQK